MQWTFGLDVADCAKGMRNGRFDVKIDLRRCDNLGCSAPVRKKFSCRPRDLCRRSVALPHPALELANYRATWEYRGDGKHFHFGWGSRSADCVATPVYREFC